MLFNDFNLVQNSMPTKRVFDTNFPWVTLYHDCSNYIDLLKNMAVRGGGSVFACVTVLCSILGQDTLNIRAA